MVTAREVREEVEESQALKQLTEVYTGLAIQRLGQIRSKILSNRQFVKDLSQIYYLVAEGARRKKNKSLVDKKGTLSLMITSGHPLYGSLENRLAEFFMAHTVLNYGDLMVVGKTGQDYLKDHGFATKYEKIIFHDDLPTAQELAELSRVLIRYEKVYVYHCRLVTLVLQDPVVTDISGETAPDISADQNFYYILEPETAKMLTFFDNQVVKLLLQQTFLEAELARTGARLVLMDSAQTKANNLTARYLRTLAWVDRAQFDSKVLEMTLATMSRKKLEEEND